MAPKLNTGPNKQTVKQRTSGGRVPSAAHKILARGLDAETPSRRHRYTNKRKLEILELKSAAWVPRPEYGQDAVRKPTWEELEKWTGVFKNTASKWPRKELELLEGRENDRHNARVDRSHWPALEQKLLEEFLKARKEGATIRQDWFRYHSVKFFEELYPDQPEGTFRFSNGWFAKCLARQRISLRFITNTAQKLPEEYLEPILNFFRFNRRNSQLQPGDTPQAVGRFKERRIFNMDQTPAPFEYLDGQTYCEKGAKTVQAKSTKSGWDKRQATLMITAAGDGALLKIIVIFRGEGMIPHEEHEILDSFSENVIVMFNETAYCNEEVMGQ
jgi:hypothetical protein